MQNLFKLNNLQLSMVVNNHKQKTQKFEGFDFLRAIFAIAIVADHAGLFSVATIQELTFATDILYANFSYVAVPVFFQISLFLFYFKGKNLELSSFFQKRIVKLIYLYLFWVSTFTFLKILFTKGLTGFTNFDSLSIRNILEFIISGGNSPLYFFFSLIFITSLAAVITFLRKKIANDSLQLVISYCLLTLFCLLILSFSFTDLVVNLIGSQEISAMTAISNIARWNYNPLNFLPYLFTASITVQEFYQGDLQKQTLHLSKKLWSLFFLFLIFTLLEWFLLKNLFHYSRLSLVFGSWLLLYLALISKQKPAYTVSLVSNLSLGIYVTHLFLTHVFWIEAPNFSNAIFELLPRLYVIVRFLIVLGASIAITYLLKKTKLLNKFV
ncbi:acyltransferase family protein [Pseudanabaena sp. ABRG5-3]|uniref:acyltransferase family protein n=1 Tax=Pseudanabaena sp. ABRG5-3 TaxID=685565 RepID=UPI000DC6FB76|nr:acyltransferase family protein [Pseudanabaena sp. ABRG5-3]BBC24301.1 hypothetical protein ABRG53_2044 [Pseudanabaena sp. ABRG5-3]